MIEFLKSKVRNSKHRNPILFFFIKRLWDRPYFLCLDFIFCYLYSCYLSYRLFGFSLCPKVFFSSDVFRVVIKKQARCKVISDAKMPIVFESFMHGVDRTVLILSSDSNLSISNTFHIGNGCFISILTDAKLTLAGGKNGCESGMTCHGKILCSDNIYIGSGSIISWGTFITDSNNHRINDCLLHKPVYIGDHVWISEGCTISPGAVIGAGSIVGAKSFVNGEFYVNSLIVGCPAKTKKTGVVWSR